MHKQLHNQWPGPFDDPVINAMLHDSNSHHWSECQKFVNRLVSTLASNFSADAKEDIVQNAMLWIVRYLPDFKRDCRLTSWIVRIVQTRIADTGREQQASNRRQVHPPNDLDEDDGNVEYFSSISSPRTVEEECVLREEIQEAFKVLLQHLTTRAKPERSMIILKMHLVGYSQEDIARKLQMPAPNVGYTIRSIQRFMREQKGHKPPSAQSPH